MKKIIFAMGLLVGLACAAQVMGQVKQVQSTVRVRFYYYPEANVYYSLTDREYWYYDEASSKWLEVKILPTTMDVTKTKRYTIYYNGPYVWKDNLKHRKKYKLKPTTVKTTTNQY